MSDTYVPSFFSDDPKAGLLTYGQLEARRRIAAALATRNRAYPKTIGEGLSALGEGLGEGYMMRGLERAEGAQRARDLSAGNILTGGAPAAAPGPVSAAPGGDPQTMALATEQATGPEANVSPVMKALAPAGATATGQPLTPQQASLQPSMTIDELLPRLARNETGGQKDPYRTIGPVSKRGDYPYGKYQVMGENIPKWTEGYLGRKMTPQEFLNDDKAQEQLARAKAGEYLTKYGPNGAAAAWFAGEQGMNDPKRKDTLGTHVAEYVRRFNIPLVSREQVVRSAARAPGGVPEQPVDEGAVPPGAMPASAPPRQDIAAAMMQQQGQPPPQQVAQVAPPPVQPPPMQQQPIRAAEERPTPAGPEPTLRDVVGRNPQLQQKMEAARRIALDPQYSPTVQAQAQAAYQELEKRANDEFTKRWTVWHERTKGEETFRLGREERERKRQGDITPLPPQQTGPDPRLGTPQSPQRTGIPVPPPVPPGVTPQKWSEVQAPQLAKAVEAVDKAAPQFDDAIRTIQLARQHPGREWGVGATSKLATSIPGTDAYGFGKIMEQIGGKNFLTAYEQLKGGGQITEIEGTKAEAAQARLATAQNKKDWDAAMNDLETVVRRDLERVQRKVNAPVTAWRAPGDNASTAPDIGERRGDKEYIGGNPADPMSWKRAQ